MGAHPDDVRRIAREGELLARAVRDTFSWRLMGFPGLEVGKDGIARLVNFSAYTGREGFYNYVGMVPPNTARAPMRNLCVVPQGEYVSSQSLRNQLTNMLVHAATVLGGGDQPTYILSTDRAAADGAVRFISIIWEHPGDREVAPQFRAMADQSKLGVTRPKLIRG